MSTLGNITFLLLKKYPGVGLDLIKDLANERLRAVWDETDWKPTRKSAVLSTVAEITTGDVDVTSGSTTVSGNSTSWTSAITGRRFRLDSSSEIYTVTFVSSTSLTLERNYEGDTATAANYKIFQNIFTLTSSVSLISGIRTLVSGNDLEELSLERLDHIAPARTLHGTPAKWAEQDRDSSNVVQVELYPIPDEAQGLPYRYVETLTDLSTPASTLPPWIPQSLITAGVSADLEIIVKDSVTKSQNAEAQWRQGLSRLRAKEALRRGPAEFRLPDQFTAHRRRRGLR